jgi:hypothetical protein
MRKPVKPTSMLGGCGDIHRDGVKRKAFVIPCFLSAANWIQKCSDRAMIFLTSVGLSGFLPVESLNAENRRRMIYAHKVRRETESVFGAFDCPDAGQSTAVRRDSTTPIQALNLMNSRFTLECADLFASRLTSEVGADSEKQIQRAYLLALNRSPSQEESQEAAQVVGEHGIKVLCRALYNCNEFLFFP